MSAEKSSLTANTADREIVISRVFDAPRELVWDAWTDPKQVVHWWGPQGFTTTIEEMDVRPGGVWKHVMRGPDGTEYPNKSIFKEVTKPERIVYSHGGGKKGAPGVHFEATWSFDVVEGNKTRLTIRQLFASAEDRDTVVKVYGAIEGGKQCLARLGEQLAKTPVVIERTFDAPIELVWKAITDKEQVSKWSFGGLDGFKAEVGFKTQFNVHHNGKNFLHLLTVTDVVPGRKIAYTWRYDGHPGDSLVTYELFSEGDKTRIKLTHEGLESFQPESNPDYARGNFVQGWTSLIGSLLKDFVEKTATRQSTFFTT